MAAAEGKRPAPGVVSPAEMTSLGRALSQTHLSSLDQSDVFSSQTSLCRSGIGQVRRRKLSSSASVDSEMSPSAEARVLAINTGGTIGMMLHDNGNCVTRLFIWLRFLFYKRPTA